MCKELLYIPSVIRSFRHKGLRDFFETGHAGKVPVPNSARVRRILLALDAAVRPADMNVPGFRFHELKGDRAGTYSVSASGNWRITFGWDGQDAINVNMEDYH
jgi:proteic killer suppression protein